MDNYTKEQESFKVSDLSTANWCLGKIKLLQKELEEKKELYKMELEKLEDYIQKETFTAEDNINYFKNLLREYVENRLLENPKFKLSVPNGTASFGKLQTKISYDDAEILEFCKRNELTNFVKTTVVEKLIKKDFNDYLTVKDGVVVTQDGEIIDCVTVDEYQNFNIKVKGE